MSQLMITVIVVGMMVPTDGGQHSECVDCPDGSMPLPPLSYNVIRSHVFNGTQPSDEGCTPIDEQATIKCGQGTTLIDCDQGHGYTINYSNLSSYFIWNRTTSVAQQVSIDFRFDQQINISRITMFFWNSQSNSIIIPNVRMYWADHKRKVQFFNTAITTNSPNRTENGHSTLNIYIGNDRLKFFYLRIIMTFYSNSEWIFLSEVQFCGNTAPFHITQPSTDNDVQIVSPTATMTTLMCTLNTTIPENALVKWIHNDSVVSPGTTGDNTTTIIKGGNTTTLVIRNFQASHTGVYQCVFKYKFELRRHIQVKVPQIIQPLADSHRVNAYMSDSISLTCSLNIKIPSSVTVTWTNNNTVIAIPTNKIITIESTTTTLQMENLQLSDTGVYQCVFNDTTDGWILRKTITLLITAATTTSTAATATTTTTTVSMPISTSETISSAISISSAIFTTIIPSSSAFTWASISGTIAPSSTATDATTSVTITPSSSANTDDASISTTYITPTITSSFVTVIRSSSTSTITNTLGITTSTFTVTLSTDISITNAALTSTNILSTNATTPATIIVRSPTTSSPTTSISAKYSTTVTIPSTTTSTTTPTVDAEETSSSVDIDIGIIAIPVIVIMVVTLVIIVVIITFFCRRKRRYIPKPISSIEEPTYNTIADPPGFRNSNLYETLDQWKRMSLEQPHRRSLSNGSSSEASLESPQVSPEESTKYLEFNIYSNPDDVKSNIPSMVFDFETQAENPTYDVLHNSMHNEGIEPSDIDSSAHACASEHNGAYPYSSIYADALPLFRSQGPPIVSLENIKELEQLGTGHFGKVMLADTKGLSKKYLGIGNSNDTTITMKVAVKMLKAHRSEEVQKSFEKEIKFMSRLKNDNVIRLLGICTTGTPFIMMEYMENGDLNKYLKEKELTLATETEKAQNEITLHTLIYMSFQIASGMKYLSTCKFIHRDLAARNILAGTDYIVKIADFGMSRNLYSADYCRVSKLNVLPVRWMAYECFYGKFSIQTDVWAFGITLWEIFTLCKCQPYSEFSDQEMIDDAVLGSNRKIPEQPENCPRDVYNIIKSCLRHEPSERPPFSALHDRLKECDSYVL